MDTAPSRAFDARPRYTAEGGRPLTGWDEAVGSLPRGPILLAVDGPMVLDWAGVVTELSKVFVQRGDRVQTFDMRTAVAPWPTIVARTGSAELSDDPHFDRLPVGSLRDLFESLPELETPSSGIRLVFGPGTALIRHDVLWYADLPKRYAEEAVASGDGRNLGQPDGHGPATTKRLFYIDWPLLDRHRDAMSDHLDLWVDVQDPVRPVSLDGDTLRRTLAGLAVRPFRTRPTFNSTSWGGHWAQRELGMNAGARNTALGYALIAPESGVLIGGAAGRRTDDRDGGIGRAGDVAAMAEHTNEVELEVPFQLVVSRHPELVMGAEVHTVFGSSFPVRFDYLDTFGGGSLSVHLHPQAEYMHDVFGWPYTQHESYYVMVGGEQNKVFLGLRGDADLEEFRQRAHDAHHHEHPFDIEKHVQTFPADPHQLYMIPAGTPHGSGEGNVVLEVSATPYLYSLRFYDWLRRDADDNQRPVHIDHAFNNLGQERIGDRVGEDLVQQPRVLREGPGWAEEVIGALPEVFFEVRRLVVDGGARLPDDTGSRFHILNVVEGDGVWIETADGLRHSLAYAETIVVPAAVGTYAVRNTGTDPVRLVKALIR